MESYIRCGQQYRAEQAGKSKIEYSRTDLGGIAETAYSCQSSRLKNGLNLRTDGNESNDDERWSRDWVFDVLWVDLVSSKCSGVEPGCRLFCLRWTLGQMMREWVGRIYRARHIPMVVSSSRLSSSMKTEGGRGRMVAVLGPGKRWWKKLIKVIYSGAWHLLAIWRIKQLRVSYFEC